MAEKKVALRQAQGKKVAPKKPEVKTQAKKTVAKAPVVEKKIAEKGLNEYKKKLKKKIVTEITKAGEFYLAEDYHQKYYKTHNITCHVKLAT